MPKIKIGKQQLLLQAITLFRTKGYNNTSMSDIADACGVFKSNLYHHFKNKEVLMESSLELTHHYFENKLFSVCYDESMTIMERFDTISRRYRRFFGDGQGGCFYANTAIDTSHSGEFQTQLKAFFDRWIESLTHLFSKVFSPTSAAQKARVFVQQLEGAILFMSIYNSEDSLDTAIQSMRNNLKSASDAQ